MNYTSIMERASSIHNDIRAEFPMVTSSKLIIEFKNCKNYKYNLTAEGLVKIQAIDFNEVIMIKPVGLYRNAFGIRNKVLIDN